MRYVFILAVVGLLIAACAPAGSRSRGAAKADTNENGQFSGSDDPAPADGTDGGESNGAADSDPVGTDAADATDGDVQPVDGQDAADGTDTGVEPVDDGQDTASGGGGDDSQQSDAEDGTDGTDDGKDDGSAVGDDGPDVPPPPPPKDSDEDGVIDFNDNCKYEPNPDQADLDKDGMGDLCDTDMDDDGVNNEADCEPLDDSISPSKEEACNGIDDNCDEIIDAADSKGCQPYFTDMDGDGAGLSDTVVCLCEPEQENHVDFGGDCDDNNPALNPWAVEICNNQDENCNLLIDDGCDDDNDGYCDVDHVMVGTPAICPLGGNDCFDWSAQVHPGAVEVPANGIDDNCDGKKEGEPLTTLEPDCAGQVCVGDTPEAMLCAMELCYPEYVLGQQVFSDTGDTLKSGAKSAYGAVSHYGSPNNDLAPYAGDSYAILSSGYYASASHQTGDQLPGSGSSNDKFAKDGYQIHDAVSFKVTLKAPPGVTGFTIDYIFMSAEYEEWIGSSYNDKFYIILKAPQTTGNKETVINFTACSNPNSYSDFEKDGQKWCYIAINTAFSEKCSNPQTNISGTGYQCTTGSSTGWLQTSWPIVGDEQFELTFHIHDTSDEAWDSLVILDNFHWEGGTFKQGTDTHN